MSRSKGGDLLLFIDGKEVAENAATLLNGLGYPSTVSSIGDGGE